MDKLLSVMIYKSPELVKVLETLMKQKTDLSKRENIYLSSVLSSQARNESDTSKRCVDLAAVSYHS